MVYCKVLITSLNSKLNAHIYCKENICCVKDIRYTKHINECGNNKSYCCPQYRKCILKGTLSDGNGNPTLQKYPNVVTNPKTTEYKPQKDIMLYIFSSVLILFFVVYLLRILSKHFTNEPRPTNQSAEQATNNQSDASIQPSNQSTEQASNNQSDASIQPLPSYSQLHFENTNVSYFNVQLRNNSHSDIERSDSVFQNDEDILPSYEESHQFSPVYVSPPSYAE